MSWVSAFWDWNAKPENWESVKTLLPLYGSALTSFGSLIVGAGTITVGYLVARAAMGQARIARQRHEAQTRADRVRRITDTFSTAVAQLGSDKMAVRVGGIYTLERLAREALTSPQGADATAAEGPDLYWTVMETLTAFVRERARRKKSDTSASETAVRFYEDAEPDRTEPATDIVAVLTVLQRRPEAGREREQKTVHQQPGLTGLRSKKEWSLDLRATGLQGANLSRADLSGANLSGANLSKADLTAANLSEANLGSANLSEANLSEVNLSSANLSIANLSGANLIAANLTTAHLFAANLSEAYLIGANLSDANLAAANLSEAYLVDANLSDANLGGGDMSVRNLSQAQLDQACGQAPPKSLPPSLKWEGRPCPKR